jgi:hypothetical protein
MKWRGRQQSSNVNDQRGQSGGMRGRNIALGGGGLGLVIALVMFLLTGDPGALMNPGAVVQQPPAQQQTYQATELEEELFQYAGVVLKDVEDTWNTIFPTVGRQYKEPTMTIYSGYVNTGCGAADSGVGPFYCTLDQNIYIDLSFYNTLVSRYGAKQGDFSMAYVIAHEAGHHVQTLLGVTDQLNELRQRVARGTMTQTEFNDYSIRYELQADYLAGVVARHIHEKGNLEQGDMQEAMSAAAAVGDDAIQKKAQGYVDPDTFNHGTSQQRQTWFKKGFDAGDLSDWDTFSASIW